MVFKSWIPTVSGRLSFDVIGGSGQPCQPICSNIADKYTRHIICSQRRILLDAILPVKRITAKYLFKREGDFIFVCIASAGNNFSDDNDDLIGDAFIFQKKIYDKELKTIIENHQRSLKKILYTLNGVKLKDYLELNENGIMDLVSSKCDFASKFSLSRDGEIIITVDENRVYQENSPKFPQDIFEKARLIRNVTSQIYFFLKDIIHTHQHHDPSTDTLLDLYPVIDEGDDYFWRCEILRLLYRKILLFKRSRKEQVLSSALGTLAYIKSYRNIANKKLENNPIFLSKNNKILPIVNDDTLKDSINASQSSLRNTIQDKIRSLDVIRNTIIAIVGTLLSLVGLIKLTPFQACPQKASKNLINVGIFLVQYPFLFISLIILSIIILFSILKIIDLSSWPIVRSFYKLFVNFSEKIFFVLCMFISLLSFFFTLWFVFIR